MVADTSFFEAVPGLMDALPAALRKDTERYRLGPGKATLAAMRKTIKAWNLSHDLVRPAVAPTIPHHCTDPFLVGCFKLARDFGLKELYLWPINADQQGTPQQVRHVIDAVRANSVPAIFSESTISSKPAEQVARETGIPYGGVLYVDSLSEPDGPVPTYLDLLSVTTNTIVQGLTQ